MMCEHWLTRRMNKTLQRFWTLEITKYPWISARWAEKIPAAPVAQALKLTLLSRLRSRSTRNRLSPMILIKTPSKSLTMSRLCRCRRPTLTLPLRPRKASKCSTSSSHQRRARGGSGVGINSSQWSSTHHRLSLLQEGSTVGKFLDLSTSRYSVIGYRMRGRHGGGAARAPTGISSIKT